MRSSIVLGALCAFGAIASPIEKRAYTTEVIVITVTETVTPGQTVPTEAPAPKIQAAESRQSISYTTVLTTSEPAPAPQPSSSSTSSWTTSSTSSSVVVTTSETPTPAPEPTSSSAFATFTSTSTSAAVPSATAANGYQATLLQAHNIHRANHSASNVAWSSNLEASAQQLAAGCVYEHNTNINGGGYGQNIGYGISADNVGAMITNLMYNDEVGYFEQLYGEANPDMSNFERWGHFSQIVWKGTTSVGCATVVCNSLGNVDSSDALPFTVCNYEPAGNYAGEYADNVGRPLGQSYVAVAE